MVAFNHTQSHVHSQHRRIHMIPNCEIIVHEILLQQKKDLLVVAPIMTDAGDLIGCLFGQLKSRTFVLFLR
jgi:hypothetical protein